MYVVKFIMYNIYIYIQAVAIGSNLFFICNINIIWIIDFLNSELKLCFIIFDLSLLSMGDELNATSEKCRSASINNNSFLINGSLFFDRINEMCNFNNLLSN